MILSEKYSVSKRKELLNFLRMKLFGDNLVENISAVPLKPTRKTVFFEKDWIFDLWTVENLDKKVKILEIKQRSKNDPRITLTRDAFKIMDDYKIDNALIVFYSEDSSSWRLSLLTMNKSWWDVETSNPKRYSFLLWEWEKIRTPKKYLDKEIKNFDELLSCFDVEVVRKEFFDNYLSLYIRLYKAILEDKDFVALLKSEKVDLVSFTKNLLWKIVFLYFIQKKGWLWVPRNWEYGKDGDKDFMRSIWNNFISWEKSVLEKNNYFYNDYLEWLFFAGLNKDNSDNNDFNEYFNQKVPYLNWWLFKEDYKWWRNNIAKISNDIFSNENKDWILDIFDLYNFTIDEDDLYDSDIAIDPEMLGRIFEKMISISSDNIDEIIEIYDKKWKLQIWKELNKKFGAFYTPRDIVAYMTKESLIAYLINNLSWKKEEKERKIRKLFELKEKFLVRKEEITEEVFDELAWIIDKVDELLKKVKILDPAIGSGAFPMWLLNEISSIRYYIYGTFYETFWVDGIEKYKNENWKISMYKIKRDIIKNNIYWVDIEPGAIDIARLRFWLALVVEEEKPEPLPNFEFKFVCANTLIPLAESSWQQTLMEELNPDTIRKYMNSYYNASTNKEKELWKDRIENYLWIKDKQQNLDLEGLKSERRKQLETFKPFDSNHSAEFFDPSLMMGNGKFDIVIGNPPYWVSIKWDYRKIIEKVLDKVPDFEIYYYFIEIAYKYLKQNWIKSYIIPNTFLFNVFADKYRKKLLENWWIEEILDCTNIDIFENATVRNVITLLSKDNSKNIIWYRKTKNITDFEKLLLNKREFLTYKNISASSKNWWLAFKLDKVNIDIVTKIKNNSLFISKFFPNISQWLIAYDKYKWQSEEIIKNRSFHYFSYEKDWLKKWLYWWDVNRYITKWNWKEYIDYCDWIANPRTPEYFTKNRILVREITNPRIFASYVEWEYYNDPSIINILEWKLSF